MLDASHVVYSELHSAVMERKCPIYGLYLMQLIEDSWKSAYPDEELVIWELVSHDVIQQRQKEKWGTPTHVPPKIETLGTESEESEGSEFAPSTEPSWAKKLKEKMKQLFCIQAQGQYKAHVAEKKARSRDKAMMRHLGMEITSVSEDKITDEEEWISTHCRWSDTEEEVPQAAAEDGSDDHEEF